jgi:hypothetical protein
MGTFTLFAAFDKVTHYPCTFLSFVRKPLVLYFSRLREPESLRVSLLLEVGFALITCSLQMIVFSSARRISWSGPAYTIFLRDMSKHPGQRLNRDKTSIFFSRNTEDTVKRHILTAAGVQATNSFEKYLGLPSLVGRSKGGLLCLSRIGYGLGSVTGKINSCPCRKGDPFESSGSVDSYLHNEYLPPPQDFYFMRSMP